MTPATRSSSPRRFTTVLAISALSAALACGGSGTDTSGTLADGTGGTGAQSAGSGGQETGGTGAASDGGSGGDAVGGVGGGGAGGAAGAGTGGSAIVVPETLLDEHVPFQQWDGPGTTTTGILFASNSEAYGACFSWGVSPTQNPPPQPYWYSSDGSSPYALYFESTGEGENFLTDWSVPLADGSEARYDAAMFLPSTPNPYGLSADAHIVTLEVNDGRGGDGSLHFVVTDATVLDGTDEVPMDVVQVMTDARAAFEASLEGHAADIAALLAQAAAESSPPTDTVLQTVEQQGLWPTWRTDTSTLELTFGYRIEQSWEEYLGLVPHDCPEGAPCLPPSETWAVHSHFVDYLVVYEVDAAGTVLDETEFGPEAFVNPVQPQQGF